jgi:hypothetical protein
MSKELMVDETVAFGLLPPAGWLAVDGAVLRHDNRNYFVETGPIQHIPTNGLGAPPAALRCAVGKALLRLLAAIEDNHVTADVHQRARHLSAQNAGAFRDHEGLAGEMMYSHQLITAHVLPSFRFAIVLRAVRGSQIKADLHNPSRGAGTTCDYKVYSS